MWHFDKFHGLLQWITVVWNIQHSVTGISCYADC